MPKVVYATYDDLQKAKAEFDGNLDAMKLAAATKVEVGAQMEAMQNAIRQIAGKIAENERAANERFAAVQAELRGEIDAAKADLGAELKHMIAHEAELSREARAALQGKMDVGDQLVQKTLEDKMEELGDRVDMEREALQHGMNTRVDKVAAEAARDLEQQRVVLSSHLKNVQREAQEDRDRIREEFMGEFARVEKAQGQQWKAQATYDADCADSVDQRFAAAAAARNAMEQNLQALAEDVRADAAAALADFAAAANKQFAALGHMDQSIWDSVRQAEQVTARRVDWIVPDVATTLMPASQATDSHVSFFSPKFKAAGARNLQIELRVYPGGSGAGSAPGKSTCALYLWADEGMSAAIRFWVGERWAVLEKVWAGREAHGTRKMCAVADQVEEGGALRVGVEFMEVFHEFDVALDAAVADDCPSDPERVGDLMVACCEDRCPAGGTMRFYQHLNHRLMPQVSKEVERMQSRLVRRVEWRLMNARMLLEAFPSRDEPICSPVFSAAGIDGMQFVFYPSGYSGAAQDFASLFLYSPGGVKLKAQFHVGHTQFAINHTWEEAGAHGRCNAVRFESAISDEDNSITIVMEVEEAQSELKTKLNFGPKSKQLTTAAKLTRVPPKESLTENKVLASVWTSKPVGNDGIPSDGYHSFDKIKGRTKIYNPGGSRRPGITEPTITPFELDGAAISAVEGPHREPSPPRAALASDVAAPAAPPSGRPPVSPASLAASRSEGSLSYPSLPFLRKPGPGRSGAVIGEGAASGRGGAGGGAHSGRSRRTWHDYEPPAAAQFGSSR